MGKAEAVISVGGVQSLKYGGGGFLILDADGIFGRLLTPFSTKIFVARQTVFVSKKRLQQNICKEKSGFLKQ